MRALFIGDIVGKAGRKAARELLGRLKADWKIDLTVANGENAAGGVGLTPPLAQELLDCGVDVITSGNHIWDKKEMVSQMDFHGRLLRPANYPPGVPGTGYTVRELSNGTKVVVVNLGGRVYMSALDCPFRAARQLVGELGRVTPNIFIDFHAEITAEKIAFGWHMDGLVTAVVGTHTHVQTADERILPGGTAYITDIGMTGALDSVIGVRRELVIERFLTQMPARFEPAEENVHLCGVAVDFDQATGKALSIKRLQLKV